MEQMGIPEPLLSCILEALGLPPKMKLQTPGQRILIL